MWSVDLPYNPGGAVQVTILSDLNLKLLHSPPPMVTVILLYVGCEAYDLEYTEPKCTPWTVT